MQGKPTAFKWNVYLEPADTNEPKKFIGTVEGVSESHALENAEIAYNHNSYDLVLKRSDLDHWSNADSGAPYEDDLGEEENE